jgi:hypothetical protein
MQPTCIYSSVLTHAEHQLCLITSLNRDSVLHQSGVEVHAQTQCCAPERSSGESVVFLLQVVILVEWSWSSERPGLRGTGELVERAVHP